jgi:hypothetical protein
MPSLRSWSRYITRVVAIISFRLCHAFFMVTTALRARPATVHAVICLMRIGTNRDLGGR